MKQREQKSPKKASAVWDLAEFGFDLVGRFSEHALVGLFLFVVMTVALLLWSPFQDR